MRVTYARQPFPTEVIKSIFLAGPTPRSPDVESWRPEALDILRQLGYDGDVFVPEDDTWGMHGVYEEQLKWEEEALHRADCILFWVPRDMATMPALTTNVEFGRWYESGKIVFGAPEHTRSVRYLETYAREFQAPVAVSLKETLTLAQTMVGLGAKRFGGECTVPLNIWKTDHFAQWYEQLKAAGNRLDGARVLWTFRPDKIRSFVFFWALRVNVFVTSENRNKTNEVVVARPDISTVMLYLTHKDPLDTEIALIREFRSPVANQQGFVYELPGGSNFEPDADPRILAADECREETGLSLAPHRLEIHEVRQMVATMSTHKGHLYSAELEEHEMRFLRSQAGVSHGVDGESEKTFVEIHRLGDILNNTLMDWSMLGMILSIMTEKEQ